MIQNVSCGGEPRYARCLQNSKRISWDIDQDVIRGRGFDPAQKFLPDTLTRISNLEFLTAAERRLIGQIQGRTYANMFGLVERFINAKVLEVAQEYWFGDQVALEALVRFSEEGLKHQALFRRIEAMIAARMPPGYEFIPQPNEVAGAVLGKSTWAVLGLTCNIELFTQAHYRQSIDGDAEVSPLFRDVFLYHWREESQHAVLDELEWVREDAKLDAPQRDHAVDDLIALVDAVDGILRMQAGTDSRYFRSLAERDFSATAYERIEAAMLAAYRWQYIVSGVENAHFMEVLQGLVTDSQMQRIRSALAPLMASVASA